jgi:hypothetical protein
MKLSINKLRTLIREEYESVSQNSMRIDKTDPLADLYTNDFLPEDPDRAMSPEDYYNEFDDDFDQMASFWDDQPNDPRDSGMAYATDDDDMLESRGGMLESLRRLQRKNKLNERNATNALREHVVGSPTDEDESMCELCGEYTDLPDRLCLNCVEDPNTSMGRFRSRRDDEIQNQGMLDSLNRLKGNK